MSRTFVAGAFGALVGLAACSSQTAGQFPSGGTVTGGGGVVGSGSDIDAGEADARGSDLDGGIGDASLAVDAVIDVVQIVIDADRDAPPRPDAPVRIDAPPGGKHVTGHVCALTDVLASRACAPVLESSLELQTVSATAEVAADGSFDLELPAGQSAAPFVIDVNGDETYYPAAAEVTLDASGNAVIDIQVMTIEYVTTLQSANAQSGMTILVAAVDQGGQPAAGVTASTVLGIPACYDEGDVNVLSPGPPTQASGTFMYFLPFGDGDDTVMVTLGQVTKSFTATTVTGAVTTARVSF